jgi:DNA-binding PadR family transcriptional regulator
MKQKIRERGIDRAIPARGASVYDAVEQLQRAGFIEPAETSRDGRRPERTIYRITSAGTDELEAWLRQMLEEPSREYPRFGAALMFLGVLHHKEEALKVLERRAAAFEVQIAAGEALLRSVREANLGYPHGPLPRLFSIEEEYAQAMRRAELSWLRQTIAELKDGSLEWPPILESLWPVA